MTSPRARRRRPQQALANEVRIIGGTWRSRRIHFPSVAEVRPTPDRVRETLFNWLGQDLTGLTCLDLFAGSGALGFEAASRGAKCVVMVEKDRIAHSALLQNRTMLSAGQVEVVRAALERKVLDKERIDEVRGPLVPRRRERRDALVREVGLGCGGERRLTLVRHRRTVQRPGTCIPGR